VSTASQVDSQISPGLGVCSTSPSSSNQSHSNSFTLFANGEQMKGCSKFWEVHS